MRSKCSIRLSLEMEYQIRIQFANRFACAPNVHQQAEKTETELAEGQVRVRVARSNGSGKL